MPTPTLTLHIALFTFEFHKCILHFADDWLLLTTYGIAVGQLSACTRDDVTSSNVFGSRSNMVPRFACRCEPRTFLFRLSVQSSWSTTNPYLYRLSLDKQAYRHAPKSFVLPTVVIGCCRRPGLGVTRGNMKEAGCIVRTLATTTWHGCSSDVVSSELQ
jgi:hypothetical protein